MIDTLADGTDVEILSTVNKVALVKEVKSGKTYQISIYKIVGRKLQLAKEIDDLVQQIKSKMSEMDELGYNMGDAFGAADHIAGKLIHIETYLQNLARGA